MVEKKLGYSFSVHCFGTRGKNFPLTKAMVNHNHDRIKAIDWEEIGDEVHGEVLEKIRALEGKGDDGWDHRMGEDLVCLVLWLPLSFPFTHVFHSYCTWSTVQTPSTTYLFFALSYLCASETICFFLEYSLQNIPMSLLRSSITLGKLCIQKYISRYRWKGQATSNPWKGGQWCEDDHHGHPWRSYGQQQPDHGKLVQGHRDKLCNRVVHCWRSNPWLSICWREEVLFSSYGQLKGLVDHWRMNPWFCLPGLYQ